MITARTARTLAAFTLVCAAFAVLAAILTSGTPARAVQAAAPAAVTYTADEAFLADLFDGATDYTPEQALYLTETGRRYCALVVEGQVAPGADVPTRDGYLLSLTSPGPQALTADEAGKLLDVAEGVYCPPTR